ncbi:LUC7-domain-containing protein [Powellomyces hirtus]|nr:LUC7-domain-containing protein [Powellomyces hirtus]
MSAAAQRKLLEDLMGKEALGGTPDNMKFTDPQVCRNYLCGLCPHDLFTNTKMDIGPCTKSHSPKLLEDYKRAQESGHPGFQDDWFRSLQEFVRDCDRKVDSAQRRLDKTPEDARAIQLMREIGDLTNEIATLTGQVESLGEEGKVSESMEVMNKVEDLQRLKGDKDRELKQMTGAEGNSQQQKLRVCEVCSAYLSIFDSDRRLADHFGGKMHLGFVKIREQVDEMRKSGAGQGMDHGDRRGYDRGGFPGRGSYNQGGPRNDRGGGSYDRRGYDHNQRGGHDRGYDRRTPRYNEREDYERRMPRGGDRDTRRRSRSPDGDRRRSDSSRY